MNNIELDKKVKQLVHQNQYTKGYVSVVDVLIQLSYLKQEDFNNWRNGKVSHLEQACMVNLSKLSLIGKAVRKYALALKLKPSISIIKHKNQLLRYSKSGKNSIENAYATRYINKERTAKLKAE